MFVAARDAVAFAKDMSYAEFARDQRTQLSIVKSVEIVGEAAASLSHDTTIILDSHRVTGTSTPFDRKSARAE